MSAAMCETKATGGRRGRRANVVLSEQDLDMIAAYKYKPGAYTHIDDLLTPFWNWAVTLLPMWMAPNLVTFIGLAGTCFASLLVTSYSPGLDGDNVPRWCSLLFAVALFLYQTLDAIDGKQARRTSSSSPLGQLFDHGCDAAVKVSKGAPSPGQRFEKIKKCSLSPLEEKTSRSGYVCMHGERRARQQC